MRLSIFAIPTDQTQHERLKFTLPGVVLGAIVGCGGFMLAVQGSSILGAVGAVFLTVLGAIAGAVTGASLHSVVTKGSPDSEAAGTGLAPPEAFPDDGLARRMHAESIACQQTIDLVEAEQNLAVTEDRPKAALADRRTRRDLRVSL